jgi:transcriptional regulator with XRE-family HTH domain
MMHSYGERSDSFGMVIRRLRKNQSLSLQSLSEQVGISASYLSRLERDQRPPPPTRVIERMAEALHVAPLGLLVAAGLLTTHTLREMGVPPYGMDLDAWQEALTQLSRDDWQDIDALIRTKLARYRHP